MLQKKERLTRDDFNRFFAMGKRYNSPLFQLIYHPYATFHGSVVVSKKVAGSAVVRNKLRRRVYDCIRNLKQQDGLTGIHIIIVRPAAASCTYAEIKRELSELIGRTKKSR